MKKRELFLLGFALISLIFISGYVSAQTEYRVEINNAFTCLDSRIGNATLTLEEAVFSALAKNTASKINDTINSAKSGSAFCWPSSSCTVKQTAQVALAKKEMNENVGNITAWLKTKVGVSDELTWYLQIIIEGNKPASCTIDDGSDHPISINEFMRIGGSPGGCLQFANSDNWLKIQDSCLDKEFNIQCNESFKTNLLYEKKSQTQFEGYFISPQTHSAAAGGWTMEKITALCFKEGNKCNYEASLWAATALYANGEDVAEFSPYLRALASDNQRYFPSAFLVAILEGRTDHYSNLIASQTVRPAGSYWQMTNSPYNKFYDTSLAMTALGGASAPEIQTGNTIGYLIEQQDENGCWNGGNIRDTAFLIYSAGWLRGDFTPQTVGVCGDGSVNYASGEVCDCGSDGTCTTTELDGKTCQTKNYNSGTLKCIAPGLTNACTFDTSSCVPFVNSTCGDGQITGSEVCDCGSSGNCTLAALDEKTCIGVGFDNGTLSCADDCFAYDTSSCGGEGPPTNGSGGGYNPGLVTECVSGGFHCVPSRSECLTAGGSVLSEHDCQNQLFACCSVNIPQASCSALGGNACLQGEVCSTGSIVQASEGACCMGTCEPRSGGCTDDFDCSSGYTCLQGECVQGSVVTPSCSTDSDCPSDQECASGRCVDKGGSIWTWIIILVILIILVALGIIFRDKLRIWWFKMRGKATTSKLPPRPPQQGGMMMRRPTPTFGLGPRPGGQRPMPPRPAPGRPAAPVKDDKKKSPRENEEDDTFKKLREMSK